MSSEEEKMLMRNALQRIEILERHVKRLGNLPDTTCERCGNYLPDTDGTHRRDDHGYMIKIEDNQYLCKFCGRKIQGYEAFRHFAGLCTESTAATGKP